MIVILVFSWKVTGISWRSAIQGTNVCLSRFGQANSDSFMYLATRCLLFGLLNWPKLFQSVDAIQHVIFRISFSGLGFPLYPNTGFIDQATIGLWSGWNGFRIYSILSFSVGIWIVSAVVFPRGLLYTRPAPGCSWGEPNRFSKRWREPSWNENSGSVSVQLPMSSVYIEALN